MSDDGDCAAPWPWVHLVQVRQSAALQVEEAEGKAAEAARKLAETEQLMVQQLKDEMSRHGREMEQVGRRAVQVLRCCTV